MKISLCQPMFIWIIIFSLGSTALETPHSDLVLPGTCAMQSCVHGVCTDVPEGGHRCFCQNGYTGLSCQTNYNDCRSEPCLNGGSCVDGIDEFTCVCDQGYTGSTCETDINECSSDPCLNDGVCEDLINDYLCHCPLGFFGINCELYFNVCAIESEFCKNDGVCVLGPGNTSSCSCPSKFYGDKCELSTCPCVRGGVCIGETDFNCLCPFGFTGKTCETKVDICDSDVCNGGLCLLNATSSRNITEETVCFCVPDFHGKFCEEQYNECLPESSCQNGATCIDDIDGFSCICPAGFIGSTCNETYLCIGDDCLSPRSEPPAIFPSHLLIHTSATIHLSSTFGEFFSTFEYSASEEHSIHSSRIVPVQPYATSHASLSTQVQKLSSHFVPEERPDQSDTAINVTRTSVSLPFNQVQPTSLEPYSTVTTSFLSEYSFQDIHIHNESLNMSDFTLPIQSSKLVGASSPLVNSFHSSTAIAFTSYKDSEELNSLSIIHKGSQNMHSSSTFRSTSTYPLDAPDNSELCQELRCQNGGTPSLPDFSVEDNKQCQCLCPLLYAGPNCERETYLLIPQFHKSSFLKHVLPSIDPEKGLDIDISFKILSPDGILFFSEAANSGAFLMLHVENGLLKLRFSCGHQTTVFMGTHAFVNNSFFTSVFVSLSWTPDIAHIRNASCNVELLVNGSSPMSGQQFLLYPQFNFRHIYIGGVPGHFKTSIPEIHKIPWFEGCVISLQVNGEERELVQEAEVGVGITECYSSACYRNPCLNGATCKSYDDHWNCECPDGYAGPFCEHKTCFANPCEYGSTCLPNMDYGYLCICPYGKHGKNCELDLLVSVPSFYGNIMGYSSYMQYQLQADYHYHLEIRLMFSTTDLQQKSLLLFNGQIDSSYLVNDFLAVVLHSGYVITMFNLGSGTRILKSTAVLSQTVGAHTVLIGRHRRYCWMEVDSLTKVVGLASGQLTALNTPSTIYVGGHSSYNFSLLPDELVAFKGFEGCIFGNEFRTSPGAVFRSIQTIVDGRNIQQCTTTECQLIQCANGGTCIDVGSTFQCKCVDGWAGTLCTQRSTPCSSGSHNCHSVSTCVPLEKGYRCNCPLGSSGKYCEKNVSVSDPLFDGMSSFLSTRMLNVRHSMDVILSIKPLSSEGLLFYAAQHLNELSRDFISLSLMSGFVQLRFNLGTDPSSTVILNTFKKVENNSWQIIEFGRYKRVAYLKLEEDEEVTSISPPGMEILDIGTNFYLGGVPDLSSLPKQAFETVPTYFKGCIRLFSVNAKHIDLNSYDDNSMSGLNIEDCDGTSCGYTTCKNGGACLPKEDGFICECPAMFQGETCEIPSQCWKHNCLHGSSCVPHGKLGYKCVCPIGWQGEHCEMGVRVSSAFFSGNSYFLYKDVSYKYWNLTKTSISFMYLTNESSGLLLWTGKIYSEDGDYLGIGLSNNHLHLVWSLGWLSRNEIITKAIHPKAIWHHVLIERNEKILSLHVDNEVYTSSVPGSFYELNTDGNYYFGGFPNDLDIEDETLGYFYTPFIGCMKDFSISGKTINIMDIKEGRNLASCIQE